MIGNVASDMTLVQMVNHVAVRVLIPKDREFKTKVVQYLNEAQQLIADIVIQSVDPLINNDDVSSLLPPDQSLMCHYAIWKWRKYRGHLTPTDSSLCRWIAGTHRLILDEMEMRPDITRMMKLSNLILHLAGYKGGDNTCHHQSSKQQVTSMENLSCITVM